MVGHGTKEKGALIQDALSKKQKVVLKELLLLFLCNFFLCNFFGRFFLSCFLFRSHDFLPYLRLNKLEKQNLRSISLIMFLF